MVTVVRQVPDSVSVLTASIPGRESSIVLAARSVGIQSHPIVQHVIVTRSPEGPSPVHQATSLNQALRAVGSEWVAVLDDDNWWLPDHIAVLLDYADDADVVYSYDRDGNVPRVNCNEWDEARLRDTLDAENFIDLSAAIIRRDAIEGVGGFPASPWTGGLVCDGGHFEGSSANFQDWELWRRLARSGAQFRCVAAATWVYGIDASDRQTVTG